MGYYSEVTIMAQPKAYKMIIESIRNYNKQELYKFEPSKIWQGCEEGIGEYYLLQWDWVKWYQDFKEVQSVEKVLDKLVSDFYEKDGYGFKEIIIYEDNQKDEKCNMPFLGVYMFITCKVDFEIGATKEIQEEL